MRRAEDHSAAHFEWLVAGRSRNQNATLDLYRLIVAHGPILTNMSGYTTSLKIWSPSHSRSGVRFFSVTRRARSLIVADVRKFLQSLIAHNAILYQTDFSAREWTFRYYLTNAIFRLANLPDTVRPNNLSAASGTTKDESTNAQTALEDAIVKFAEVVATYDPK